MGDCRVPIDKWRLADRRSTQRGLAPLANPSIDNPINRHASIGNLQSPTGN
jgi:hypothetical protein